MSYRKPIYKPYPFVFGSSLNMTGLGLSGPGGILWPLYPPTPDSAMRSKSKNIPVPPFLVDIDLGGDSIEVGSGATVKFEFIPNLQKAVVNSDLTSIFGSLAKVFTTYQGALLYEPDVDLSTLNLPSDDELFPEIYVVFAHDGEPTGLPQVPAALIEQTAPLDLLLTMSGSLTPNPDTDSRTCNIKFKQLILVFYPDLEGTMNAIRSTWLIKAEVSNGWSVGISSSLSGIMAGSVSSLVLTCPAVAISHPDQMGYASYYWGGLTPAFSQTATIPVVSFSDCQNVLGPTWIPHTTFYPIVELAKTPIRSHPSNKMIVVPDDDLSYRNDVAGFGLLPRFPRGSAPEIVSTASLLEYPSNEESRYASAFSPGAVDTRIVADSCIYPVVGPEDHDRITNYWTLHSKMTDELYFQRGT